MSHGVLGTDNKISVISASAFFIFASSVLLCSFSSETLFLTVSASAFFPSFINWPTWAERVFNSDRRVSNSA